MVKPPSWYFSKNNRTSEIHHTRLRNYRSELNGDLFNNYVLDTPKCACGAPVESADHYFFTCPRYFFPRVILFDNLESIDIILHDLTLAVLLSGTEHGHQINVQIFSFVQEYIAATGRF